ncbi:Uncharacterised protein [Amycolatopsis camponoti]|uniref:Uncharacterized protein n=1 Tax=Amycolatopsis camponoti TaxID=2606593 RepID=A0A6I8M0V6_9PSEU|nr:Uncharacterised protein [Amycolatopsis camponoti]
MRPEHEAHSAYCDLSHFLRRQPSAADHCVSLRLRPTRPASASPWVCTLDPDGPSPVHLARLPGREPDCHLTARRRPPGHRPPAQLVRRSRLEPHRDLVSIPVSFVSVRAGPPRVPRPVDLRVCARQTPLNTRVQTWKACWVHALAGSNPVSSALEQAKRRAARPAFRRSGPETGGPSRIRAVAVRAPLARARSRADASASPSRPAGRPKCEMSFERLPDKFGRPQGVTSRAGRSPLLRSR